MSDIRIEKIRFSMLDRVKTSDLEKYDMLVMAISDEDLKKILPTNKKLAKIYAHFLESDKHIVLIPLRRERTIPLERYLYRLEKLLSRYIGLYLEEGGLNILLIYDFPEMIK